MSNGLRKLSALCGANPRAAIPSKAPRRTVAAIAASFLAQAFSLLQRGGFAHAARTRSSDVATPAAAPDSAGARKGDTRAAARRRRAAKRNRKKAAVIEVDHEHGAQTDLPANEGVHVVAPELANPPPSQPSGAAFLPTVALVANTAPSLPGSAGPSQRADGMQVDVPQLGWKSGDCVIVACGEYEGTGRIVCNVAAGATQIQIPIGTMHHDAFAY